jgi:hypothetical protein
MLFSTLLNLLTEEQKRPYLFELLGAEPLAGDQDPHPHYTALNKGRWLPLADRGIIAELPQGTFTIGTRDGVQWVYPTRQR